MHFQVWMLEKIWNGYVNNKVSQILSQFKDVVSWLKSW
jgi:hypothetical protein